MPVPAAPPTHIMVTRGDARLQVLAQGEGHPIVLLPSLGRGARDFDAIAASLAGAGYRVLRPQPRGVGESRGPWDGIRLEDLAADFFQRRAGEDCAGVDVHVADHVVVERRICGHLDRRRRFEEREQCC